MTNPTDVIILSSSPSISPRIPTRSINNKQGKSEILQEGPTTEPLPSPSGLFLPPSRSRFFDLPARKDDAPKNKRSTIKKTALSDEQAEVAPRRVRKKAKEIVKEPTHKALDDLETQSLDHKKNDVRKTAGSQKTRAKPKAKKETGNQKLAGKVIKASKDTQTNTVKTTKKAGQKNAAAQSPPVDSTELSEPTKPSNALGKDEDLHLDEATRRRRDWTPPRETLPQLINTMDNGTALNGSQEQTTMSKFGGILTDYNYVGSSSDSREISANEGGPTKRRRIELVDPQCNPLNGRNLKADTVDQGDTSSSASSSGRQARRKPKTQKRFTTLTARMTAQYTSNEIEEDPRGDDITQYITKPKSCGSKSKPNDRDPDLILLSPDAAFKALDQQDVVFGTCSQLERDDSPETLREVQRTIHASETLAFVERGTGFTSSLGKTARSGSTPSSMSRLTGGRNLWSVAGRDTAGSLIQTGSVEKVDLTDASHTSKPKDAPKRHSNIGFSDDEWLDLDYGKPWSSRNKPLSSMKVVEQPAEPNPPTTAVLASPVQDTQPTVIQNHHTAEASQPAPMPQYNGFTDVELSRQVASYGFKSVKGRKKMIDLLQKCWESRHGKADQPLGVSSQPSSAALVENITIAPITKPPTAKAKAKGKTKIRKTAPTAVPTEPPMRTETVTITTPKKNQQRSSQVGRAPPSSYIDVEEIQDSEEEVFLSPSQVQQRYTEIFSNTSLDQGPSLEILTKDRPQTPTKRKAAALKTSRSTKPTSHTPATEAENPPAAERASQLDISIQIAKAVRAQPRLLTSYSRSRPSWHEKILMYDPIVLEDFTSWLNVEGLGLIGEDREVGTAAVREWCESKGICCCWKKNAS
ncbi:Structure-specific endonuclease subunit slx4 [Penicillium rolfsii]|nr:Structure-specific endonuclease subunit slx4 [Penicillium rolfsii]